MTSNKTAPLSILPVSIRRVDDLKAGDVLSFTVESSPGVPLKALSTPRSRRVEVDSEIDSGYGSGSSTTLSARKLPELVSFFNSALETDPATNFQLVLKDSVKLPFEPWQPVHKYDSPRGSLTCLCEVLDPKAQPGSPGSSKRQAVIKFRNSESLYIEQAIYAQLQALQGTFMPIFLGRLSFRNSGMQAILLEYVERVPISSILKTPKQLTDVVESSFIFFERMIELNMGRDWQEGNIAITAEAQLVFFGFGQCHEICTNPGNLIYSIISHLRESLGFECKKFRTWQLMMRARAIVLYFQCLEEGLYTSRMTDERKLYLEEQTLSYRTLALTSNPSRLSHSLYDVVCGIENPM